MASLRFHILYPLGKVNIQLPSGEAVVLEVHPLIILKPFDIKQSRNYYISHMLTSN